MIVLTALLVSGSQLRAKHPRVPIPPVHNAALNDVNDFVYQLQNVDLTAVGRTRFDLAVIDYSSDGSEANRFTLQQINTLKATAGGKPGSHKLVISYLSIGEAEDYRFYWSPRWMTGGVLTKPAPDWLGPVDPDWPGNFKVKYWEPAWQQIVFAYLDKIIDAGFDGVYLDIIDAYQFWGPGGAGKLNRKTAEKEMVDFVKAIADHARITRGVTNFTVFVQNAEELVSHADYVAAVDGIGKEDTWYNGNAANPASDIADTLANLDLFKTVGRKVLTIDYVTKRKLIDDYYAKSLQKGYVPYASVRDLNRLTINPGHAPD